MQDPEGDLINSSHHIPSLYYKFLQKSIAKEELMKKDSIMSNKNPVMLWILSRKLLSRAKSNNMKEEKSQFIQENKSFHRFFFCCLHPKTFKCPKSKFFYPLALTHSKTLSQVQEWNIFESKNFYSHIRMYNKLIIKREMILKHLYWFMDLRRVRNEKFFSSYE